jgi:hypothetical protein
MSRRLAYLWLGTGVILGAAVVLGTARLLADTDDLENPSYQPPRFVSVTDTGVDHTYDGGFSHFVGGGVAVLDCDDDRRPDLYFAGGENPAALYRNESAIGAVPRFVLVDDDPGRLTGVTGAYPLDVDADDITDLAVLRDGENVMLRGRGDCRFERANETWGLDGGDDWTVAFSAKWDPGASYPTMAFGNYVNLSATGDEDGCSESYLFRPGSDGYGEPVALAPAWCTLSILFSDWDRSGRVDLRMTNDRHYSQDGEDQLWRMPSDAEPTMYEEEDGWQRIRIWGMGIAGHDLTGDGFPEYYLTSQADNKLQTLAEGPEQPTYRDIALASGVTAHRPYAGDVALPSTAWHPEFQDVNNDGLIDLYVSKGNVEAQPGYALRDPNNLYLGQPDGTFVEVASVAGITSFKSTRGAAVVDLNLDGMLDLVEVNRSEPVAIWWNVGWGTAESPVAMGDWLALSLHQPGPNTQGVGSWIEVRSGGRLLTREVTVGGGHAGGQAGWIHFGLGETTRAEVRVSWPDGEWGPWMEVESNRFAVVGRDSLTYADLEG